jgi:hypothetical protein
MLAHPEAVKEAALGQDGFLPILRPGRLWVDCSTVNPSFSMEMAAQARARHSFSRRAGHWFQRNQRLSASSFFGWAARLPMWKHAARFSSAWATDCSRGKTRNGGFS